MEALRVDQYLRHETYGLGVVVASTADRTTIDFEEHGLKKFVTGMMVVELLPGAAPRRPRLAATPARKAPARALPKA